MMRGELPHHQTAPDTADASGSAGSAGSAQPLVEHHLHSRNPALAAKISQMRLALSPLVRLDNGAVHPAFPSTVLRYWLLTDEQCEALAHFYHQRSPGPWSAYYPCPIVWNSSLSLEEKRRKIGRFIGLQGCDSPIRLKSEEEIAEEARRARITDDEAIWRGKLGPWR